MTARPKSDHLPHLRWMRAGLAVVVVVLGTGVGVTFIGGSVRPAASAARWHGAVADAGAIVVPKDPQQMAVAPNGTLYVVDGGRDQVLRRLADGRFQVIAGNGKRGFTGDGGPAVDAEIHVGYQAGIAVASNGTVYFSDDWNDRVREVLPDGTIKTVAGGGSIPLGTKSVPALDASIGGPFSLFGLTTGPDGELSIGTSAVYRLAPDGTLHWIVGEPVNPRTLPKQWGGVYSNPAIESDFTPATRLAFDGRGDLFVAGGGGWGLYEKTVSGALRFIEVFRGDGYWGSLASGPDGTVILAGANKLARVGATGTISDIPSSGLTGILGPHNGFRIGEGVAVASNGDIYLDTDAGNGWTSHSAIVQVTPTGHASLVWEA